MANLWQTMKIFSNKYK